MNSKITLINPKESLTPQISERLVDFLYTHLGQFRDPKNDIAEALVYAQERGGTLFVLEVDEQLAGVCVVLDTGMKKFVPRNFLVYIAVDSARRGQGLGGQILEKVQSTFGDSISLHVEHENPAKRLYERMGFTSKYAEMRWSGN